MGTLYERAKLLSAGRTSSFEEEEEVISPMEREGVGSLYEKAKVVSGRVPQSEESQELSVEEQHPIDREGFFKRQVDNIKALFTGEVSPIEVAKEMPGAARNVTVKVADTFVPGWSNLLRESGSLFGDALAYAIDPNVRKQFNAGNLDVLPTLSDITQADIAKDVLAAAIETAVYRSFPTIATTRPSGIPAMNILVRGGAGALQGLGFAVASGLAEDKSAEEIIDSLPEFGVGGAVISIASPYLLPLLKSEMASMPKEFRNIFRRLKEEIKPPKPRKLTVGGDDFESPVNVMTPGRKYQEYLRSQGYEPYIPDEALPTIQMGSRARPQRGDLPEIQMEPPSRTTVSVPEDARLVREEVPRARPRAEEPRPRIEEPTARVEEPFQVEPETRTTRVSREQLPVGEGQTVATRLESRMRGFLDDGQVAQRAEKEGVTTYQQMRKPDQMRRATQYVVSVSDDEALAVLRGDKPAPEGLLNNSIFLALEKKATEKADAALAMKLASLRSTRFGQEISILTEAEPFNAISRMQEIIKARAMRVQRTLKKGETVTNRVSQETKKAREFVNKNQLKIEEAESLLNQLVC